MSNLADFLFKTFLYHVKSYIRDSTYFLNKYDRNTNENRFIAFFVVADLHANIPHSFGLGK